MAPMEPPPPKGRTLKLVEDVVLLAAAAMLAVWAFTGRSPDWMPVLWLAIAVTGSICIRRLVGWIRATRGPTDSP